MALFFQTTFSTEWNVSPVRSGKTLFLSRDLTLTQYPHKYKLPQQPRSHNSCSNSQANQTHIAERALFGFVSARWNPSDYRLSPHSNLFLYNPPEHKNMNAHTVFSATCEVKLKPTVGLLLTARLLLFNEHVAGGTCWSPGSSYHIISDTILVARRRPRRALRLDRVIYSPESYLKYSFKNLGKIIINLFKNGTLYVLLQSYFLLLFTSYQL